MNKNKKFIISSIIATILAAVVIFLIIDYQNQKTQQQLQQEIAALKKEHDQLLIQIPKDVNWQSYVDEFYSAQVQKIFQQQKEEIKKEIKDLKVNVTCNQSDLKAQKQCWLKFNQQLNQTINNFHYFNDSYYDSYQKFNTTLNTTKNQIHDLLTQMSQLNITEFNNTVYDLNFFSLEKQNEFQSNKSQIIATIEQLNNSQNEQITTCSQNKTLYQQLGCCRQYNQEIKEIKKQLNVVVYHQKQYLLVLIKEIKQGIEKIQTELKNILTQDSTNIKIAVNNIANKIKKFEKNINKYQTWSQFKAYYDFLAQHQNIFQGSKCDIDKIKDTDLIKTRYRVLIMMILRLILFNYNNE